jgi:hypothetical protein
MTVFWDVAPCSLVEVYQRFRGAYCLLHQGDESLIALMCCVGTFDVFCLVGEIKMNQK